MKPKPPPKPGPYMPGTVLTIKTKSFPKGRDFTVVENQKTRTKLRGPRGAFVYLLECPRGRGRSLKSENSDRDRFQPCTIVRVFVESEPTPSEKAISDFFGGIVNMNEEDLDKWRNHVEAGDLACGRARGTFSSPVDRARVAVDRALDAREKAGDIWPEREVGMIDDIIQALEGLRLAIAEQDDLVMEGPR